MIIFSDSEKLANKILPQKYKWEPYDPKTFEDNINSITKSVFNGSKVYNTSQKSQSIWKYLYFVNHAHNSHFDQLLSITNKNTELSDGILILAGSGSNFHGFRNRSWASIPGNIHLCIYLTPRQEIYNFQVGFTILSAVSIIQTLDSIPGLKGKASIRWINDIIVKDAKVSGVLTQTQSQGSTVTAAYLGIGINVEKTPRVIPDLFVPKTISLKDIISDQEICNQSIIFNQLINNLELNYFKLMKGDYLKLLEIYRSRSEIIGKYVEVFTDPLCGTPEKYAEGKVTSIGENLELNIDGLDQPITKGRVRLPR